MNSTNLQALPHLFVGLVVIFIIPACWGYTYEQDVYALNNLYTSLGSPILPGWIPNAGDPCLEGWQGIQCVGPNITSIILNAANLGGELGDKLDRFSSIITIDLSNNHIGGVIPENLPLTMQRFFLSANQFTGSIPSSLSALTSLTDMSLNNNMLSGALPNAFQSLTALINLDLSFNNLSSQLPPTMNSLSSLTTLHIQNNQLSGTLDVLHDLPLKDLNIENNLFSGRVPTNLYKIPTFKSNGNPFNTTISPSSSPPLPFSQPPVSPSTPSNSVREPSVDSVQGDNLPIKQKKLSTQRIIGCVFATVISVIILVLAVMLIANYCISRYQGGKSFAEELSKRQELGPMERHEVNTWKDHPSISKNEASKLKKVSAKRETEVKQEKHYEVDKINMSLPSAPDELVANPASTIEKMRAPSPEKHDFLTSVIKLNPPMPVAPRVVKPNIPMSVLSFSIGSLQQYTNSFSEENIIRDGLFGRVYQAELPDGNLSAIMKLDNANNALPEDGFYELVLRISGLRHPNIVELVGYCVEYGQRLLVYNYFSRMTLHDVLHSGDDLKKKLSWNARIQVALRAARALEYLHEACQPPAVHQNFESTNILLNEELDVCICDCGLGSLVSLNPIAQLSGRIQSFSYEAPEINYSGSYTEHSDVYSFGVVMLELLTGRKPYDSSQPRSEQYLVRWASSQFHDINMLTKMVDPSVDGKYPMKSLSRFADIISRCVQHTPEFRPVMSEVVQDLKRMVDGSTSKTSASI